MTHAFRLPDPGEGIHEAEIVDVCVAEGDAVHEGDIVLYIETDKATVEVPSPCTGTIATLRVQQGDIVQVGDVLMTFAVDSDQQAPHKQEQRPEEEVEEAERPAPALAATKTPQRPVPAAPATRRLAMELGVDLHDVPGSGPGERVTAEDVRAFADQAEPKPARKEAETPETDAGAAAREGDAEEEAAQPQRGRPLSAERGPLPDFSRWGPIEHVPLQSVRRATARRMALAWSEIPHAMHQDIADITELEAFRRQHQADIEQQGGQLSLTVLVLRAVVAALKQFPRFNASLDPDAGRLILKHYYHISVAVDTERGLIVPVVRDVDRKSMTELARELTELTERVRQGKVQRDELQGGTFTLTNPGAIGGTAFTPIINYPQVAILGLARARLEPVVQGDMHNPTIAPRWRLPLHLAFDHRVNDGADAARFVRTLIDVLHDPESLLLRI